MTDDENLKAACRQVALNTMWEKRPVDVDDIDRVADSFFLEAKQSLLELENRGYSGDFVEQAVRYLASTHAIPPMRDDVHWFRDMLAVLVELAGPNSAPASADATFYRDLLKALAHTLARLATTAGS